MTLSAGQRVLRGRLGGLSTAARGHVNTAPARQAFLSRFDREVDAEGVLPPAERARRSEAARRLFFAQLAFSSSKSRAAKKKALPLIVSRGKATPEVHADATPTP